MAERGEDGIGVESPGQPVEDAPPVGAEHIGQDTADAHAAAVEHLLHAVSDPASLADEGAPVAGQHAHFAKRLRRHVARRGQTELAHPRQPYAVGDIGLAAPELLDLTGVDQGGGNAGILQRLERRQPVDAGAFHHRGVDASLAQPGDHLVKAARQRLEGARLDLWLAGTGRTQAHRGGDLHLVHVEARGARVDDMQGIGHHGFTSRFVGGKAEAGRGRSDWTHIRDRMWCDLPRVHDTGAGNNPGLGADRPEPV